MIDESREDIPADSSDELAAALQAVTAASPELAEAIAAAGVTPDDLATAHERVTTDQGDVAPPVSVDETPT